MSLNEAYLDLVSKGELPDVGDAVVRAGVSTLIDYSKPAKPAMHREVTIAEIEKPKRIGLTEILAMTSNELEKAMSDNPNLQRELDALE